MKRIAAIAVIGWLLVAGSAWTAQVTNVEISYQDGFTVARIDIQGPVRFTHQTEVPKDGRPDRVIVDLLSATHDLGAREFLELPPCFITGIRSSQYAVSPEKITRIVFDLAAAPVYRVESDDQSVTVYFNEKEPRSFAAWSTRSVTAQKKPSPTQILASQPTPAAVPKVAEKSVQGRNEAIEQDRATSLKDNPPTAQEATAPSRTSSPTTPSLDRSIDTKLFSETLDYTPSIKDMPHPSPMEEEYGKMTDETPAVVQPSQPIAAVNIPEPVNDDEDADEKPDQTPQLAAEKKSESAASKPVATSESKTKSKPVAKVTPEKPVSSPSMTWVPPMAFVEGTSPAGSEPTTTEASESTPQVPVDNAAQASAPTGSPSKAEHVDTVVVSPTDFEPAVEPEEVELAEISDEPEPGAARATSRFRREVQTDKIRGTMVAEFPERLVIKYETGGQRDPFRSLIDETQASDAPVVNRIPNVEGLKLVGIIDSDGGRNQALFEDKTGFSYILKTGDKVRNGYVLRVEPEQVYFQIFEYGWSRTVALTME